MEYNKEILDLLSRTKKNNRLMHVYLFYGDDLKIMKNTAFHFASMLYCGCNNCELCQSILDNNHLNVYYIEKEENKSNISKEQIINLESEFSKTSLVAGPRIYIINGIDKATSAAQNSLLKFIEEPQNKTETYGIFIANDLNDVLATIKSRVGQIYFKSLSKDELEVSLQENFNVDEAFILSTICSSKEMALNYDKERLKKLVKLVNDFLDVKSNVGYISYYLNHAQISKDELLELLLVLIRFYEGLISSPKLISNGIYDKMKQAREAQKRELISKRLENMLMLEIKLKSNVIPKNVLHQLIYNFI